MHTAKEKKKEHHVLSFCQLYIIIIIIITNNACRYSLDNVIRCLYVQLISIAKPSPYA